MRKIINIKAEIGLITKGGYRHFMEKEIFEQPSVIPQTISTFINNDSGIKIDLNKLFIYRDNQSLKINNTEKIILEKMINSPGKVFKREEIGNLIDLDKERSIDVMITRLRKKIEENPKSPKYLQTMRGEGYVLWIE